ncbi:hypothetical protein AYO40_03405 [Planctomycetaceae bacterium SCGC AG-212-D15]|nr:hypothetical protein AYO40_03405 [Planctomycetaceae bacterium SCGC AG-212-D15]
MGVFDWIQSGKRGATGSDLAFGTDDQGKPIAYSGSFSLTIGNGITSLFGTRHTHIFGPEIKMVTDIEDMLGTLVSPIPGMTALTTLLSGIGGNVTFCYGTNITATYVGPKVEIRRAANLQKTGDTPFARAKFLGPGWATPQVRDPITNAITDPGGKPKEIPGEKWMRVLIAALSVILTAGTAAMELVMRAKYSQFGKAAPPKSTTEGQTYDAVIKGYGETPQLLNALIYTLPPRIMKLIQVLETSTSYTEWATWFKNGSLWTFNKAKTMTTDVMNNAPDLVLDRWFVVNLAYYILHLLAVVLIWLVGVLLALAWAILMLATVLLMIGAIVGLALWAKGIAS